MTKELLKQYPDICAEIEELKAKDNAAVDFIRLLTDSMGLRSYWSENSSFRTLNFVSISIMAQR